MIGAGQMGTDVVAEVKMMKGIDVVMHRRYRPGTRHPSSIRSLEVEGDVVVVEYC